MKDSTLKPIAGGMIGVLAFYGVVAAADQQSATPPSEQEHIERTISSTTVSNWSIAAMSSTWVSSTSIQ